MRPDLVQPDAASQRRHAAKSSNTCCLLASRPSSCQAVPYSPPPRSDATARRPPRSIQASHSGLERRADPDVQSTVPVQECRHLAVGLNSRRRVRNTGTRIPSSEATNTSSVTKSSQIPRQLARADFANGAIRHVNCQDRCRRVEALECQEQPVIGAPSRHVGDGAEPREHNVDHTTTIEFEDGEPVASVVQICGDQAVPYEARALERIVAFGDDLAHLSGSFTATEMTRPSGASRSVSR